MKLMKQVLMGAMIATSFVFIPSTTHAGVLSDLWNWITSLDQGKPKTGTSTPPAGNSVPVNEGLIVLVIAGLLLGGYMIYNYTKRSKTANSVI